MSAREMAAGYGQRDPLGSAKTSSDATPPLPTAESTALSRMSENTMRSLVSVGGSRVALGDVYPRLVTATYVMLGK